MSTRSPASWPRDRGLVPAVLLIGARRSLAGSIIGGIAETREMLGFCARNGICAEVEMISADRSTMPGSGRWAAPPATVS